MNKKNIQIFCVAWISILATLFTSCQSKIDSTEQWRRRNEKAFSDYENNSKYKKVTTDGSLPYVFVKWIKKGEGKEHPIETSRVVVHYAMYLLIPTSTKETPVDGNFDQEKGLRLSLNRGGTNKAITGVQIAMQNMVVGDHAEVIIPWYLAYGAKSTSGVPAYSALRYEVRLDEIIPEDVEE